MNCGINLILLQIWTSLLKLILIVNIKNNGSKIKLQDNLFLLIRLFWYGKLAWPRSFLYWFENVLIYMEINLSWICLHFLFDHVNLNQNLDGLQKLLYCFVYFFHEVCTMHLSECRLTAYVMLVIIFFIQI